MLDKKVLDALNRQINQEFSAAYNYLAMAAWFEKENLTGFAKWMTVQRSEELVHAMKIFKYVCDRDGQVVLEEIPKPPSSFKDPHDVFTKAFALERGNTKSINELYGLTLAEKDYTTQSFLKWFLDEQVEEEQSTNEIESLLARAGSEKTSILFLNEKLGQRASAAGSKED